VRVSSFIRGHFRTLLAFVLLVVTSKLFAQSVAENIRPIGQICVADQACVGSPAAAVDGLKTREANNSEGEGASVSLSPIGPAGESEPLGAPGGTYEIQMRNQGSDGVMVFEPSVLRVQVGDSVTFKATDAGHNSASIEGMIPPGAEAWDGGMSQDITITLTEEGTYVYQCTPHLMMAMVGVITVGDLNRNFEEIENVAADKKSAFVMEQGRLDSYLQRLR